MARLDDFLDTVCDILLQHGSLGKLALHTGRQPDAGQRPILLEESLGVEHGACAWR